MGSGRNTTFRSLQWARPEAIRARISGWRVKRHERCPRENQEWWQRSPSSRPSPPRRRRTICRFLEMSCSGDCKAVVEQSEDGQRLFPLLGRNDSVEIGERDRPGRSSRRPADWLSAPRNSPNGASSCGSNVFGGTPKTAGETPALPRATASFRLGRGSG